MFVFLKNGPFKYTVENVQQEIPRYYLDQLEYSHVKRVLSHERCFVHLRISSVWTRLHWLTDVNNIARYSIDLIIMLGHSSCILEQVAAALNLILCLF